MSHKQTFKRRGFLAAGAGAVAGLFVEGNQRAIALSGGGDQGPLILGSNNFYIAGSSGANFANTSSAPTVVEASPNFGNFIGSGPSHVFKADATPASAQFIRSGLSGSLVRSR